MKTTTKKSKWIPILLGTLLFSTTMFGLVQTQTSTAILKGKVVDKASQTGIPGAKISINDLKGNLLYITASNANGEIIIKNIMPGTYNVSTSVIGYNTLTKKNITFIAGQTKSLIFEMGGPSPVLSEIRVMEKEYHQYSPAEDKRAGGIPQKHYETTSSYNKTNRTKRKGYHPTPTGGYNQPNFNTEAYSYIMENDFKNVSTNPLSTFSIDVDAASYSNMRRFVNNGQMPPVDAVRIEEMINYFSYNYPQPKGDVPFSITTEMSDSPWNEGHKLVHIGLQGKKIDTRELPATNLVFLLDVSGSMSSANKLPLLKKSFQLLVQNLREEDRVAIVVYAGAAGLVLPSTSGDQKEKILNALNKLNAGGSTAGGAGIKLAYKIAIENLIENGNNRVILATDGDFNIGASSDGEMTRLIEEKRKSGVFLTCLGFGMGNYKDSKMETLADKGNGNYAYIDNILEAKKVLVTEMGGTLFTIAKDVKLQVEFNPNKVASYKLIGYENRLLNEEDFNDDTKDAGELGAGHTVTALYEIVLKGNGSGPSVDPLRYQEVKKSNNNKTDELLTVKFRYKEPKESTSKLIVNHLSDKSISFDKTSDNFRFSAAVAEFGMLLRNSKHKAQASYKQVLELAKQSKGADENGYRAEFIRLVGMCEMQASALKSQK